MSDKSMGVILTTAIAAPVMIICCGGGVVIIGSAGAGAIGFLSGAGVLTMALIVVSVGTLLLALRNWRRARQNSDPHFEDRG